MAQILSSKAMQRHTHTPRTTATQLPVRQPSSAHPNQRTDSSGAMNPFGGPTRGGCVDDNDGGCIYCGVRGTCDQIAMGGGASSSSSSGRGDSFGASDYSYCSPHFFGGHGYGGHGGGGGGIDRRHFNEKSKAAQKREDAAKDQFDAHRREQQALQVIDSAHVQQALKEPTTLLQPADHLTAPCWRDFKAHVKSFAGWEAKRTTATEAQKTAAKETRKGKVYFVQVLFKGSAAELLADSSAALDEAPPMGVPVSEEPQLLGAPPAKRARC